MMTALELTERHGDLTVVTDLSFTVRPGTVTGFLGLDALTRGHATVSGRSYAAHPAPLTEGGALLEARSAHPGRTARHHLQLPTSTHQDPSTPTAPYTDPRLSALTEREREILTVIGQGWTNTEIATRLHLAESTVKTHVGRVLAKTRSRDRIQAVILAYDTKLVEPS
ncbi:helix-turn-helix transcriptional regulator [Streptomyces incanus]|uniref:LuxR C-terminal-related transcriptional regulator n=1 Tax=Streptomyces incanus TaxID=887453 RepID=A0ABW0XQQ9_9ACTN